jgi:hypothetical protein
MTGPVTGALAFGPIGPVQHGFGLGLRPVLQGPEKGILGLTLRLVQWGLG